MSDSSYNVAVGNYVKIERSRTRWQRFKHWLSTKVLRCPDPDLYRITEVTTHTLTLGRIAPGTTTITNEKGQSIQVTDWESK